MGALARLLTGVTDARAAGAGATRPARTRRSRTWVPAISPAGRALRPVARGAVVAAGSAAGAGGRAGAALGQRVWAAVADLLPRVPVRDLQTLRRQHPGLDREELADALVRGAAGAVAAVGVTGGVAAFSSRKVPAWLVTIPVALTTEAVVVAAVEAKLIAELYAVYEVPLRPGSRSRGGAVLAEWAERRDLDPTDPRSLRLLAGLAVRRRGARAVTGSAVGAGGRSVGRITRFGSAMVGGFAGAGVHRRNLAELAEELRTDLRARSRRRARTDGIVTGLSRWF